MEDNKLAVIVKESGLESTKGQVMIDNFQDYGVIVDEWKDKAFAINITDESQIMEIEGAKVGLKFIARKRLDVESKRKELKAQSLSEGKAIDGIANYLKNELFPIEEHLKKQAHFVQLKKVADDARIIAEAREKEEQERAAKEQAERDEQERQRLENIKLKQEAKKREEAHREEREEAEKKQKAIEVKAAKEKEAAETKEREIKAIAAANLKVLEDKAAAIEEKARKEKEEAQEAAEAKAKIDAALIAENKRMADEQLERERKEKEELQRRLDAMITCPKCGHEFSPEVK